MNFTKKNLKIYLSPNNYEQYGTRISEINICYKKSYLWLTCVLLACITCIVEACVSTLYKKGRKNKRSEAVFVKFFSEDWIMLKVTSCSFLFLPPPFSYVTLSYESRVYWYLQCILSFFLSYSYRGNATRVVI